MRCSWDDMSIPFPEKFLPMKHCFYTADKLPEQSIHLSIPKERTGLPLVIFFHGGGLNTVARECPDVLFNGEYIVAEPRYRLLDDAVPPAQIHDAARAIAWCFEHADEYGFDRDRIFVGGMSAGAYLAAISVMDTRYLESWDLHYRDIAGLVLVSGQMTTHFNLKSAMNLGRGRYYPLVDEFAPLSYLEPDLPPILLVTGESGLDLPARPEENAFAAATLRALGHPLVRNVSLPGRDHGGALDGCNEAVEAFIAEIMSGKR